MEKRESYISKLGHGMGDSNLGTLGHPFLCLKIYHLWLPENTSISEFTESFQVFFLTLEEEQ
jgi:hypothetical protein